VATVSKTITFLVGTLVAVSILATVASGATAGLREIRECVEANMPRLSTVQKLALDVEESGETVLESRLTLYWRRIDDGERRIVLRFREPEELARSSLLIHKRPRRRATVYIYLPDQGKPRAISGRGELEGFLGRANLGIDEMELLLQPLSDKDVRLLDAAADLSGRPVWAVEERKSDADVRYVRIVTFIDQEYCIPLRAELYDRDGLMAKVMEIDAASVTRVAQSWVPTRLVFHDRVRETDTILRVEDVEVDAPLAPSLLTVESLPKLSR
jgi:hypothetical protein